jgi:nitroreductase
MKKHSPSYETQELREFAEVLRGRRTIELFLQTPVPDELVREAITAATWAPNHHVTEPWRFILPGEQTVQKILDLCQRIVTDEKGAELALHKRESWGEKPGWLMVTCERSDDELRTCGRPGLDRSGRRAISREIRDSSTSSASMTQRHSSSALSGSGTRN